jgi:hypothetical protein
MHIGTHIGGDRRCYTLSARVCAVESGLGLMNVRPYHSAVGVTFGSSEGEATATLGPPLKRMLNSLDQVELWYPNATLRFSGDGERMIEATLSSEYFEIEGCAALTPGKPGGIAFVELGYAIAKLDPASFIAQGFFVSPAFGLAFDPHHAPHLTVFAHAELAHWRRLS